MPELRERVQIALGSAYTIDRELGGGGMGRVYLVRDSSLGRRVVVKVLPPEGGADVSVERFKREIHFAAQLQHANIVPLLMAGDADGIPYYMMPFIDGESLRGRLMRGALPIPDAIAILKDVARALAFAHERGVVHRDIKPENVMLSGDAAVVTDFGIAKALSVARTGDGSPGSPTLTSIGTTIGTPAYMAPEQASADPAVDHRADIYAFGCVAYELLAGVPPFQYNTAHQLLTAHFSETPKPLPARRPDCPATLAQLVGRCLEKDPERRPQQAREIVEQLNSLATVTDPDVVPVLGTARRRWIALGAAAVLLAVAAAVALRRSATDAPRVQLLTVLPFVTIGGDSTQAYLADGMGEELATALGKTRGVRVVGRTAANRFRGRRDVDVRAVGEALGVNLVVQGSLLRSGDGLRVNAQLTDARSGEELWADSYQRDAQAVLAVRDEITQGIIAALRDRFGAGVEASPAVAKRESTNPEAYDMYLRGQHLLNRRAVPQAAQYFERAIARDSLFGRAHSGLAAALALYPYFTGTPHSSVQQRLIDAANRALALDGTLAEAHTALAMAHMHVLDWERSHAEHRIAVRLDPSDHAAHLQYGRFLAYVGMTDSALAEYRRAQAIDPFSSLYSAWVAGTLWQKNERQSALSELRRALELDSLNPVALMYAARMFVATRDTVAARRAAERLPAFANWSGIAAYTYGQLGDRARADSIIRTLEARPRPWFGETSLAWAALGVGDTTAALDALERASRAGEFWPAYFPLTDGSYDIVRRSARFITLVRSAGLPARVFAP